MRSEEIDYVMMCVDANQDGKVDFNEFTDRFHSPAKDIGFNVAVLLTNLSEHIPNDSRFNPLKPTVIKLLHFECSVPCRPNLYHCQFLTFGHSGAQG